MNVNTDPFEELPYDSFTVEWTAPERLAMGSMLHGGPRPRTRGYRVLELGCGSGNNLRAMAFYRRHSEFVGLDGARVHVESARADAERLGLDNLSFVHADIEQADDHLVGEFDYIVAHGVFSWVRRETRDALLELCAGRVASGGVVYLGYNTRPGWNVRGLVRRLLLDQTAALPSVEARAQRARELSATLAARLETSPAPYSQLLARELSLLHDLGVSYVAHEYLAPDNHPYWRGEFMALAAAHGLEVVADADYYSRSGARNSLEQRLAAADFLTEGLEQAADLLGYRQHHRPILSPGPITRRPPSADELAALWVASPMVEEDRRFVHPRGVEITPTDPVVQRLLAPLASRWPKGVRVGQITDDVASITRELEALHKRGLIELRFDDPAQTGAVAPLNALNEMEAERGEELTTAYHTSISVQG